MMQLQANRFDAFPMRAHGAVIEIADEFDVGEIDYGNLGSSMNSEIVRRHSGDFAFGANDPLLRCRLLVRGTLTVQFRGAEGHAFAAPGKSPNCFKVRARERVFVYQDHGHSFLLGGGACIALRCSVGENGAVDQCNRRKSTSRVVRRQYRLACICRYRETLQFCRLNGRGEAFDLFEVARAGGDVIQISAKHA